MYISFLSPAEETLRKNSARIQHRMIRNGFAPVAENANFVLDLLSRIRSNRRETAISAPEIPLLATFADALHQPGASDDVEQICKEHPDLRAFANYFDFPDEAERELAGWLRGVVQLTSLAVVQADLGDLADRSSDGQERPEKIWVEISVIMKEIESTTLRGDALAYLTFARYAVKAAYPFHFHAGNSHQLHVSESFLAATKQWDAQSTGALK